MGINSIQERINLLSNAVTKKREEIQKDPSKYSDDDLVYLTGAETFLEIAQGNQGVGDSHVEIDLTDEDLG